MQNFAKRLNTLVPLILFCWCSPIISPDQQFSSENAAKFLDRIGLIPSLLAQASLVPDGTSIWPPWIGLISHI